MLLYYLYLSNISVTYFFYVLILLDFLNFEIKFFFNLLLFYSSEYLSYIVFLCYLYYGNMLYIFLLFMYFNIKFLHVA